MGSINATKIPVSEEVAELMSDSLVWDNHGCMPLRPDDESFLPQLQRYRDAGVNVAFIKACAETGGVIGINGLGTFLGENDASTHSIVRHIDYVAQLVGPRHVGLGLDYVFDMQELDDYVAGNPKMFPPEDGYGAGVNFVQPEQVPEIAQSLLKLGYPAPDVRAILGENHLRIARMVWK